MPGYGTSSVGAAVQGPPVVGTPEVLRAPAAPASTIGLLQNGTGLPTLPANPMASFFAAPQATPGVLPGITGATAAGTDMATCLQKMQAAAANGNVLGVVMAFFEGMGLIPPQPTPPIFGANAANVGGIDPRIGGADPKIGGADPVKTGGKDVKTGGKDVKTGGKDVKTGGKDVKTGGKDVKTGGKDVKTGGKDIQTGGKDIQTGGKDIQTGGKDAGGW
jgi:hypothetical protein